METDNKNRDWPPGDLPGVKLSFSDPVLLSHFEEPFDHFAVTFALPVHLPLEPVPYEVVVEGGSVLVALARIAAERLHERSAIAEARGMEYFEDPGGELVYSRADVKIALELLQSRVGTALAKPSEPEYVDVARVIALEAVNAILTVYRHLARAHHVSAMLMRDISQLDVVIDVHGYRHGGITQFGSEGRGFGPTQPLRDEQFHRTLRASLLMAERVPDLVDELELRALSLLSRGEYRLAVVEARTALEVALDSELYSALHESSDSLAQACALLGVKKRGSIRSIEDALSWANINAKLSAAAALLKKDLLAPSLDVEWPFAKILRERAFHSGHDVSQDDGTAAVQAMFQLAERIRE